MWWTPPKFPVRVNRHTFRSEPCRGGDTCFHGGDLPALTALVSRPSAPEDVEAVFSPALATRDLRLLAFLADAHPPLELD